MREETADIVFPVLRYGLQLRKRAQSNRADELDLDKEQQEIKKLIQATPKARDQLSDYQGEASIAADSMNSMRSIGGGRSDAFLGIRYALSCWMDEIMIQDDVPTWKAAWDDNKIETALHSTNDRAWKFWDQARRAQPRQSRDSLEAFYLCTMLGFRGRNLDQPDEVKKLREQWEASILEGNTWTPPPEKKVFPNHTPLTGARSKQKMLFAFTVSAMIIILGSAIFISSMFK